MRNLIVVAAVLAMVRPADAQPTSAQAEVLFRQGKEFMAAGRIAEACAAFDASQKLAPTVSTLMNQANCRERNDQLATAWGLFLEVARQTRAATDRSTQRLYAAAADRAAKLEPRLSTLRIDVPADSRIGGLEILRDGDVLDPATWNKALPIDGGSYSISARAPGNAAWSSRVDVALERDARIIEIPRLRAAELVAPPPKVEGPSVVRTEPVTPEPRGSGTLWSTRRKLAVATAGGGVLALAAGTVLGVSANSKQRDAHALCPDPQLACDDADRANELVRAGHSRAIGADVAFGVGAAAVIAAGVLWFTGAPESPHPIAVGPAVSPGQVFLLATRRF